MHGDEIGYGHARATLPLNSCSLTPAREPFSTRNSLHILGKLLFCANGAPAPGMELSWLWFGKMMLGGGMMHLQGS